MEGVLKQVLIGKEKREKLKALTKPIFEELNSNLVSDIKATMESIEKSITETAKDKWWNKKPHRTSLAVAQPLQKNKFH